jgi:hypothetical protein
MPLLVTTQATVMCPHGGRLELVAERSDITVRGGGAVVGDRDVLRAPILGCPQAGPGIKPCTKVVSLTPGSTSLKVKVGRQAACVAALSGITDGVPMANVSVVNPGQATVQG